MEGGGGGLAHKGSKKHRYPKNKMGGEMDKGSPESIFVTADNPENILATKNLCIKFLTLEKLTWLPDANLRQISHLC